MTKEIQNIVFRKFGGVYINGVEKGTVTDSILAMIQAELMQFNYTLSKPLLEKILNSDTNQIIQLFKQDIFPMFHDNLGDKGYKQLYPDFPEGISNDDDEVYFILNALKNIHGIDYEDLGFEESNKLNILGSEIVGKMELKNVKREEIIDLAKNMLESNVTLSLSDSKDLFVILDILTDSELENMMKDTDIKIKETTMEVVQYLGQRGLTSPALKTATDVLRFIALVSDEELNTKHIHFKKFKRSEVKMIVRNLERIGYIKEDMNRYKKVWKKFFRLNASKVNLSKYPKVKDAVDYLFGEVKFETMGYKLQSAYLEFKNSGDKSLPEKMKALDNLLEIYKKRSGDFSRALISILSEAQKNGIPNAEKYITNQFLNVIREVNSRVLYQLIERIDNLNLGRYVEIKGRIFSLEETKEVHEKSLDYLKEAVLSELKQRASLKEPMGLVYIDESLKDISITTSEKESNGVLHPMTKGSRIPLPKDSEIIRLFIYWENYKGEYDYPVNVDIDLSVSYFDKEFKRQGVISYYTSSVHLDGGLIHSGDITRAPEGAIEFVDIDLEKVKFSKKNVAYASVEVQSYSLQSFKDLEVRVGMMALTKHEAETHKLFKSSAVVSMFDLTSDTTNVIPVLVDFTSDDLLWLDTSFTNVLHINNSDNLFRKEKISEYFKFMLNKKVTSVYDVLKINAEARGILLDTYPDKELLEHVTLFDKVTNENPLQLADILSNYL